ncbi:hypothetical protein POX_c03674 [Penicillium oxalicum]|uniref:Uncharacterized protein n=1 Tax=Penicillium oxalicum (strain 114-2 / CGMCC 5302) TaxID=933388 RepID=S7Z9B8_PENO1|nr:hypothetical protein POX_c03674 [Penicillium oxalicum]EPS25271.1 hypothetical protein PDE_00204 [Penicillium oxalicum 114-2]KAI2790823.1 hypothetical protein POX_c03674 [Penicillium oxalicum]
MDLQGTPIGTGPRSTKVTTDPRAYQEPIAEPSGPVASDSLAAESVRSGGAFAENRGADPVGPSGNKSTLNTTDTSAASELPSAAAGSLRENTQRQEKYPEALGGQGNFPGTHVNGYAGGSTAAKQEMGMHQGGHAASQQSSGQAKASSSTSSSQHVGGQAPSYVSDVTPGHQAQQPKGANNQQAQFGSEDKNASFNAEIGSENDPGRLAEQKFQQINAHSANDSGRTNQKGVHDENVYTTLSGDQRA